MLNEEQLGIEIRLLEEMAFRYGRLLQRTKKPPPELEPPRAALSQKC